MTAMASANPARHTRASPADSLPLMTLGRGFGPLYGELLARGLFFSVASDEGRIVPQVGTGIVIDGTSNLPRGAPPRLGEHTDTLLCDLRNPAQTQARSTEGNTR